MSEGEPRSERETIEAALAETKGRVSGPLGAAAKLRIPPSTLETRIKASNIDKRRFKYGWPCPLSKKEWDRTVSVFSIALISEWR